MELRCDVVVLGAGAAGLAAARVLSRAGASAVVIEARERIGGRLYTREDAGPVPVELGSEFVHGPAGVSFDLLRAAHTVAVDTGGAAFTFEDGELRESEEDPFDIAARVIAGASLLPEDVSIDAFLATLPAGAAADRERRWTRMLVEGFDAADPQRASTRALAEEWGSGEGGQTSEQFRPLGGYAHLMRTLHDALDPALVHVRLESPAHTVHRDERGVTVEARTPAGAPLSVRARAAIVTLPAGVLNADDVRFVPELPRQLRDALSSIVMGPVRKLVLRFRTAFWERLHDGRFRDAAFFHNPGAHFPTFWTQLPLRAQLLVAWAGGPKADTLANRDEPGLIALALDDLRVLFGSDADPAAELVAAYTHDWQRDPYARGAYSYIAVGGTAARAQLAAPVDGVLFFAGEATAPASEAGTVAGALQSGERAAREALAALSR